MVSKSQIKYINSLGQKKYRSKTQLFIAEGKKAILDLLNSPLTLEQIYTTANDFPVPEEKTNVVSAAELKKISKLKTPQQALALFHIPKWPPPRISGLVVALDGIQDPGNLGTIIRMCDWFGVEDLVCSEDTVDPYNPKVVQATMGSIARVRVHEVCLPEFLKTARHEFPVFGAFLDGQNVYNYDGRREGILVMGNEGNGISSEIQDLVTHKLVIPQFGKEQQAESLNVATATAVFLSEFRRNS